MRKLLILLTFIFNSVVPSLVYAAAVTKVTANGVKYTVDKGVVTMQTPVGLDYVSKIRYINAQIAAPANLSPSEAFAKSSSSSSSSSSSTTSNAPVESKVENPPAIETGGIVPRPSIPYADLKIEGTSAAPATGGIVPRPSIPYADLKIEGTPAAPATGGIVPRPSIPISQLNIPSTTVNDPMERPVERVSVNNDAAIMNSYKFVPNSHTDSNGQVVISGGHYEDKNGNTIIPGNKSLSGKTEIIPKPSAENSDSTTTNTAKNEGADPIKTDEVSPTAAKERTNTFVTTDIDGKNQLVTEHINDIGIITSTDVKPTNDIILKDDTPYNASSTPTPDVPLNLPARTPAQENSILPVSEDRSAPALAQANIAAVATVQVNKLDTTGVFSKDEMLEAAKGKPPEDESPDGYKFLYSNATNQIVKRLGEPGFYVSKFLDYRKQINKPTCTASEKVNFASTMTSLVGEVTVHLFDYFEVKKLKKQFAAKIDEINKYKQNLQANNKKILDYDEKAPEIQLDSLKHLKSMAEVELKRAEMVRVFAYVALALDVTSEILSSMEIAAEAASVGTLAAKRELCAAAQLPKVAATDAQSSIMAMTSSSWFQSLQNGANSALKVIQDNPLVSAYETARKTISKDAIAEQLVADKSEIKLSDFAGIAGNAAYAENMMVSIVSDVIKKWRSGKTPKSAENDINNLNKQPQSSSGIMKFFKTIGAEDLAIRAAVRILIKQNILLVNSISKSGIGRKILFAYNVYTKYKIIEENQGQVDYAKQKISILNKTINDFEGRKTTWIPFFNKVMENIFPTAEAAIAGNYISPRPACIQELLPTCSLNKIDVVSGDLLPYFNALPQNVQSAQKNVISSNYSLLQAYKLASGTVSYDDIDVEKIKTEIKSLEAYAVKLEKNIPNQKEYLANKESTFKKLQGEVIFPASLMASYGKSPAMVEMTNLEKSLPKNLGNNSGVQNVESTLAAAPNRDIARTTASSSIEAKKETNMDDYEIQTNYSSKESDIFQIISNRYQKVYSRIIPLE